jgi:hypothetical protein
MNNHLFSLISARPGAFRFTGRSRLTENSLAAPEPRGRIADHAGV